MPDPYVVLDVDAASDDETIRRAYTAKVRQYPPSRHPVEFQRVRDAYEKVKDAASRLEFMLFDPAGGETIEELIEEVRCQSRPRRLDLDTIRKLVGER